MSTQIDCPYRVNVRREGDLEVADCQLLSQITSVCDAPLITVHRDACQACHGESRPTRNSLNPTMAGLLNRMCEKVVEQKGVIGCDIQKAERLKKWSYDNIPLVPSKSNPLGRWRGFHEVTCDQHPGRETVSGSPCIHLTRSISQVIGQGFHRSGWPYAVRSLMPMFCQQGILFDDFVEQRFSYGGERHIYTSPWVGIFHHPGHFPAFVDGKFALEQIFKGSVWQESEKQLRGAIALSEHLAKYLSNRLKVPVVVIKHPSEIPERTWSEAAYLQNSNKKLVQLGWYLRNTRAIYQVPSLRDHEKFRCLPEKPWVAEHDRRLLAYWQSQPSRAEYGDVTELGYVPHETYDSLLTSNVILTELLEASANNVVIECIARNTPLIVNRHPAAVEYLTPGYPLFFDNLEDVPALLTTERVIAAHRYLRNMDKDWLNGDNFCNSIRNALTTMDLSRPARPSQN